MSWSSSRVFLISVYILTIPTFGICQNVLTPPYFNLAEGRRIVATATCGVGVEEPELFCKLVGANADKKEENENLIIQGQVCDHCIPGDAEKGHPAENAVDGRETWWQSPPLSRGMKYNEVNLTIDLGQEFHVAYVLIKMGNSPRPGVWVLERSSDNGQTFSPWQYFADTVGDCQLFFGSNISTHITSDDSVICNTEFSKIVPLEGGEIIVPLVQNRPAENDFFNSALLQEWTRATNVRFRLLRVKNLLGHLMSVARQDPTTTRRYFYSIKHISIGGRCRCNGHADVCNIQDPNDAYKLICNCQHNTCGHNCEVCCEGFEQKKWSQSKNNKLFVCEKCNCFGHSDQCVYNETVDYLHLSLDIHGKYEGGGVCQNCQHHTTGNNCDRCINGYYRPFGKNLNDTDVCQPCECNYYYSTGNCYDGTGQCECKPEYTKPNCDSCSIGHYGYPQCKPCECFLNGTRGFQCEAKGGQCPCKPNFGGKYCKQCAEGYYSHPECKPCDCNEVGSSSTKCDINSGECKCKSNFGGRSCNECVSGYYSFPSCLYCNCDIKGTTAEICSNTTGKCICKQGYGGPRCDQCVDEYTGFPDCKSCNCSSIGSVYKTCDQNGKCHCLANYGGKTCDQCSPGFYKFPDCISCNCIIYGMNGLSCDNEGRCMCKPNFDGIRCEVCKEGFYNYPLCEECNFDPAGVLSTFVGCGSLQPGELVSCKPKVTGRICNECKELYWNLQSRNPEGCEECQCNTNGTMNNIGTCNSKSGQCICKPYIESRKCDECVNGFFNLTGQNLFGCTDCDCDVGGSINGVCDKKTGQCTCHPRIHGRTCKEPILMHYFPTLHQYEYEAENGQTLAYTPVRYEHDEAVFPGYSWKGYAVFSFLQNETIHQIVISKSSVYRMVFRYINTHDQPILATISAMPEDFNNIDTEQKIQVLFKPTRTPSFITAVGSTGYDLSPLVLNPGPWVLKISSQSGLFLDYFVLIPAEYYEPDLLVYDVITPCLATNGNSLCRHYQYPSLEQFDKISGEDSYLLKDEMREAPKYYYNDVEHQRALGISRIPELSGNQRKLNFELQIRKEGAYVLAVNYISKQADQNIVTIQLSISTGAKELSAFVPLYPCKYSMICRQVTVDEFGKVAKFQLDRARIVARVKNDNSDEEFGIHSVVAIPYNEWNLDYIQPKPSCIRKDGVCVSSTYLTPPDTKRVEFKTGNEIRVAKTLPATLLDNSAELIYLDKEDPSVDVRGKVPVAGQYVFIVHYYQPDYPEFEVDVLIHNGQVYEAKLPVQHCPSVSGCRAIIVQLNGNKVFQLTENVLVTLKLTDNSAIWLHYFLITPKSAFQDQVIEEQPFDQTALFLAECGKNHFYLNVSESGFCREATYSLTTKYNAGAVPCRCDFDGSIDMQCNPFGGQCKCHENVIGRRCDSCKTGYFGFPDCKPCDCPAAAYCEPTGECKCQENVKGEQCDECVPYTYGYHPTVGCSACNCNVHGVNNSNLQCNLDDGSCECKANIEGRTCNRCKAGHWYFPQCASCKCDLRGTTEEICNQNTSACLCKSNAQGIACDLCRDGTFNLQPDNSNGCTKCFCFGKSKRCSSSSLFRSEVVDMENWGLANINVSSKTVEVSPLAAPDTQNNREVSADMTLILGGITYFVAPESYLGNKLTAYGGFLNHTILDVTSDDGDSVGGADVIFYGSNIYLFYHNEEQPAESDRFYSSVQITENNFLTISNSVATREQLMVVLQNLTAIYIKASYWDASINVKLSGVTLEIAVPEYAEYAGVALSVEQCQCPPNYVGLSCEECADGYFRVSSGPFGGFCMPCQCNGHANTCDKNTGVCHDCRHSTRGEHCEKCEVGYYGNATYGTANDCLICACPLPHPSNNFATSCEINDQGDKIGCECIPGYTGSRCEKCAPGFYGQPDHLDSKCVPCECNGNIDSNDPESCDPITGQCLKCLNNTYGEGCSVCAPNYFGDAIVKKNCQKCVCDQCGTKHCDHHTGECTCHVNVVGEKCDRCADHHFGFSTCSGCTGCNCGKASESLQCDDVGGHCRCKPGVSGRTCDKCSPGFWQYTPDGCTTCGCNVGYSIGVGCNSTTGLCECLPGVIGDKCDTCPHRWVLIPNEGCLKCDDCTHGLLDVTDELKNKLNPIANQFQTVAIGYFTVQRLVFLNDTVNKLSPNLTDVLAYQFDLTPFIEKITNLNKNATATHREINSLYQNALKAAKKSELTHNEATVIQDAINKVMDASKATVFEINKLAFTLETGTGPQTDYALTEGKKMLEDIRTTKVEEKLIDDANANLNRSEKVVNRIKNMTTPLNETTAELKNIHTGMNTIESKLDELDSYLHKIDEKQQKINDLNNMNKKIKLSDKAANLEDKAKSANLTVSNASELVANASAELNLAKKSIGKLESNKTALQEAKMKLRDMIDSQTDELFKVKGVIADAKTHADDLKKQADLLDSLAKGSRVSSETAVQAATSYRSIVQAIEEAANITLEALKVAENATEKSNGLPEVSKKAYENSEVLLQQARLALQVVQDSLSQETSDAVIQTNILADVNAQIQKTFKEIDIMLESLKPLKVKRSIMGNLNELTADKASQTALDTLQSVQNIIEALPKDLMLAQQLRLNQDDIDKSVPLGFQYVNRTEKQLPNVSDAINRLKNRSNELSTKDVTVQSLLEDLRQQISASRDAVDKIRLGINITKSGSVELHVPSNIQNQAVSTYISFYLKTNSTTGLVLFLGNAVGTNKKLRKVKSDDFIALILEEGNLVLLIDLGAGIGRIKNTKLISNDRWYKILIERTGKTVKLAVQEDLGKDFDYRTDTVSAEKVLDGLSSVLNLDKNHSRLFLGGLPSSFRTHANEDSLYNFFTGQLEELVIGDTTTGVWDFVKALSSSGDTPDTSIIQGSPDRDRFTRKTATTSYRLNGEGYIMLSSRGYELDHRSNIVLRFKSPASEGLLFLVLKDDTFISIELRNGYIVYQYKVGLNRVILYSRDQYNDDLWHTIDAVRAENRGELKIDGVSQASESSTEKVSGLQVPDYFFIGGYPNDHKLGNVTKVPFDGCLDHVEVSSTSVDLNKNANARGLSSGCSDKFTSFVSFEEGSHGYAKWTNATGMNNYFEITLRIRTKASNGLLVYGVDGKASFMLLLSDGDLIFRSGGQEVYSRNIVFNDGQWHPIMAVHNNDGLKLIIDDFDQFSSEGAPIPIRLLFGTLYFGSVSSDIDAAAAIEKQFVGCIGDATMNGVIINFGAITEAPGATIGKCSGSPQKIYTPPERTTIKPTTTAAPSTPIGLCTLPPIPAPDPDITDESGYRFGTTRNSGLVYDFDLLLNKKRHEFSIDIKTVSEEGIIFYAAHRNRSDLIAVFLREGKVHLTVSNSGGNKSVISSVSQINNAEWHSVNFSILPKQIKLSIDRSEEQKIDTLNKLMLEQPFYLGAVESPSLTRIKTYIEGIQNTFEGCIRNFKVNSNVIGDASRNVAVIRCSSKVESGYFFAAPGGFIKARERFNVGRNLDIKLRIKPRNITGLLVSVHGKKDFAVLQIVNGTVNFTVDAGSGPQSALFVPPNSYYFCDGEWHTIEAVKTSNVLIITVDKSPGIPTIDSTGQLQVDTEHPLYIGGHPTYYKRRGIETAVPYIGCMQNIEINQPWDTSTFVESKNVSLSVCPTI